MAEKRGWREVVRLSISPPADTISRPGSCRRGAKSAHASRLEGDIFVADGAGEADPQRVLKVNRKLLGGRRATLRGCLFTCGLVYFRKIRRRDKETAVRFDSMNIEKTPCVVLIWAQKFLEYHLA